MNRPGKDKTPLTPELLEKAIQDYSAPGTMESLGRTNRHIGLCFYFLKEHGISVYSDPWFRSFAPSKPIDYWYDIPVRTNDPNSGIAERVEVLKEMLTEIQKPKQ